MPPEGNVDRRGVLTAGASGALGITTLVLPAASAAATATITVATSGYGPSGAWFELTGGTGGDSGNDGESAGGGGSGQGVRIRGSLPVAAGDVLTLHAGGGGGDGAGDANSDQAYGRGGGSTHPTGYDGGNGGHPGDEGFSGGGGGGGAATVLTQVRVESPVVDVVAAGGGGGGGTGNSVRNDLDARDFDANDTASSTVGGDGQHVAAGEVAVGSSRDDTSGESVVPSTIEDGDENGRRDGGGGGGGGGGLDGGGRGTLFHVSSLPWYFGRGGRRGRSSVSLDQLTVESEETFGEQRDGGSGTVRWHTIAVTHST